MKLDALKSQGKRTDLTLFQIETKLDNIQKIGKKFLHSNEVLEVFQCLNTKMSNEEIVSNIIKLIKLLRR